jgi:hypothetical protein
VIELRGENEDDLVVLISGKEVEILDEGEDFILAECKLADLTGEQSQPFPDGLDRGSAAVFQGCGKHFSPDRTGRRAHYSAAAAN